MLRRMAATLVPRLQAQLFSPAATANGCSTLLLNWDLTPEAVTANAEQLASFVQSEYDKIAAAKASPSWEAVCGAKNNCDMLAEIADNNLTFLSHVSEDKAVRDASSQADEKLSAVYEEMSSRQDVYEAFKAYEALNEPLTGERKRFLDRILRDFRRRGMHLDEATRLKVLDINKRISSLGIRFSKNLGEENTKLHFSADELKGMPEDFMSSLTKRESDGKFELDLSYPHSFPLLKLCQVPATRKQMETAFNSRCKEINIPILDEVIKLRQERAQLLGYPNHAAFILEERMAKTPDRVMNFLNDLSTRLTPLQAQDMQAMLELRKAEESANFDGKLNPWDMLYYRDKIEKTRFDVDHEAIKQYFPLERVTEGLLGIYQELLGVTMTHVPDAQVWHKDVKMYKVTDSVSNELMGFMYLDLHPREGKYKHAACFGLQPSCALGNGRLVPATALVCNFPKSTPDKPSLLPHSDVETFFHEFGHGVHGLCSKADMVIFAGTRVERDFVELPSQMLENWVWEKPALQRMSGRLSDGAPLPDELIAKLTNSRRANAGVIYKRQLLFALYDQALHAGKQVDVNELYKTMCKEICDLSVTEGTSFPASFGHLMGYDAQYYGYLWSEVYAMDIFESVFKGHLFDSQRGRDYREKILSRGGSRDGMDMLKDLLGREPRPDAFLEYLSVVPNKTTGLVR